MNEKRTTEIKPVLDADSENFGAMMEALEWYFHVTSCNNHTPEERRKAFLEARKAFTAFAYDDDETAGADVPAQGNHGRYDDDEVLGEDDPKPNAPGSNKVH